MTTISVSKKTRDQLAALGSKKETYDQLILDLIEEVGWQRQEARWNKMLKEGDFIPVEKL